MKVAYQATECGKVIGPSGKVLKTHTPKHGYATYCEYVRGLGKRTRFVHRLVLEQFHGPPPEGAESDHIDRNKMNNHKDNLRWVSHSENMKNRNPYTFKGVYERSKSRVYR
jgi:hypothetical protein